MKLGIQSVVEAKARDVAQDIDEQRRSSEYLEGCSVTKTAKRLGTRCEHASRAAVYSHLTVGRGVGDDAGKDTDAS